MKRRPPHARGHRRWIAVLAILALLCNVAFAIACDVHDLGHPAMAHGGVLDVPSDHDHGRADGRDDHGAPDAGPAHPHAGGDGHRSGGLDAQPADSVASGGDAIDWHAVFHVGHGIAQALGLTSVPAPAVPAPAGNVVFPELAAASLPSPPATILRPPIRA